jgi:hypothetical protein
LGYFVNNKCEGFGYSQNNDGSLYVGEWKKDYADGKGIKILKDSYGFAQ